jgi:hypothetical protein
MKKDEVTKSHRSFDMIRDSGEISIVIQGPSALTTSGSLTPGELNPLELL